MFVQVCLSNNVFEGVPYISLSLPPFLHHLPMLKRMTDKLGSHFHKDPMQPPSSPSSLASSSVFSHFDRRPSQTTTRTSMSELSKLEHRDSIDYPELELFPLSAQDHGGPRQKGSYRLEDFIIQRTLGTGSFGRVHLGTFLLPAFYPYCILTRTSVRSRHNLRFYAIKVLNKARIVKLKQVEHTNNEHGILEVVQHPLIVNIWGAFQDAANLYMVMDFVPGGELFTLLRRSNVCYPPGSPRCYSLVCSDFLNMSPSSMQLKSPSP